jgi:AcrR family transcriptional regulator
MAVPDSFAGETGNADRQLNRPSRQRNPRGQGAKLRDEIIEAAAAVLERTGNEASITLRAVAREVGVAPPSISRHFADRGAVIDAVVAQDLAELRDVMVSALAAHTDPVEALFALNRAYYEYGRDHPNRYKVVFERRFLPFWQDEQRTMEQTAPLIAETFGLVVTVIQSCIEMGYSNSTDPFADATALWCAVHGLVALPPTIPSFPWPDIDQLLITCVTRLLKLTATDNTST